MSKFGIELEFSLLDEQGYPVLGSTSKVIRDWRIKKLPNPPVPEYGSFQIELNPGPWPLTSEGIDLALENLNKDVHHLYECASSLGLVVSPTPFVPYLMLSQLEEPAFLVNDYRTRATTAYFSDRFAVAEFDDGDRIVFPGEIVVACLNEIHIHVQLDNAHQTLELFNAFNQKGMSIIRPFQNPIKLNGKCFKASCTTMQLFEDANGEMSNDGNLCRVGFLPKTIQSAAEYAQAVSSFNPIPCGELVPPYLPLESSVWFWTRLRGSVGNLRVEFRPMDMGHDWQDRVRYLVETAHSLNADLNKN